MSGLISAGASVVTELGELMFGAFSPPIVPQPYCLSCPIEPKDFVAGVFFDGTGNNKWEKEKLGEASNVSRLWDTYEPSDASPIVRKLYILGVGSGTDVGYEFSFAKHMPKTAKISSSTYTGGASGLGGDARIEHALAWCKAYFDQAHPDAKLIVDVFGFSRGAALARTFCNRLLQQRAEIVSVTPDRLTTRFLGIYDTVGSFGLGPLDLTNWTKDVKISTNGAIRVQHFVALHEYRDNFPLTQGGTETAYAGAHSDVGGGYPLGMVETHDESAELTLISGTPHGIKKSNHLAALTYRDMALAGFQTGCPFRQSLFDKVMDNAKHWGFRPPGIVFGLSRSIYDEVNAALIARTEDVRALLTLDASLPPEYIYVNYGLPMKHPHFQTINQLLKRKEELQNDWFFRAMVRHFIHRSHQKNVANNPRPDMKREILDGN